MVLIMVKNKEKKYEKPELITHGDLKVMTTGGVSGGTESGDYRL